MLRAVEWMQGKVQELEMHLARGSGIYVQLKPCLYLNDAMPHNYPLVRWLIGCTSLIHDSTDRPVTSAHQLEPPSSWRAFF